MIQKIAKICFNNKDWSKPSGTFGKSLDTKSYETKVGFGHEEWLFDKSKTIKGYHFGFLQPLSLITDKHVGKVYDLFLYSIFNNKKFLVANIKNAYCVSREESSEAYKIYKEKGWLSEMIEQLKLAGVDTKPFKNIDPTTFFNLKFQFKDLEYFNLNVEISIEDKNITTTRYKLLDKKSDFELIEVVESLKEEEDLSEGKEKSIELRKRILPGSVEYDPYHDKIQRVLRRVLKKEYQVVLYENYRVDLKAKTDSNHWHFFEIKTSLPKQSIRIAIGQLMEYAYFPSKERASKLIVISDQEPDPDLQNYLIFIRQKFKLPIYYRYFLLETEFLSKEY